MLDRMMGMSRRLRVAAAVAFLFSYFLVGSAADTAPFDLNGPSVDVHVTRNGASLPIAQVPTLLPGDKLRIHADLPDTQSVHYLLIVAFLRGATNPPPDEWFTKAETWKKPVREEGIEVVVPAEAQQAAIASSLRFCQNNCLSECTIS